MYDEYRKDNKKRILEILDMINHPIKSQIEQNITLFSNKELFQIAEYLESWSLNTIYQFLEDKKQEYIDLINELKLRKRYVKLEWIKKDEQHERLEEFEEIEKIEFNF